MDQIENSSSSTITDCANFGTTDSDCESKFDLHTPYIMNLDETEVFKQLMMARYGQSPYDQYSSWSGVSLWHDISRKVYESNQYVYKSSLSDILSMVQRYHTFYTADPSLSRMQNNSLKKYIQIVFGGSLSDQKGSLKFQDIERVQNESILVCSENFNEIVGSSDSFTGQQPMPQQIVIPSTSDVQGMTSFQKEIGYKGLLSVQYAEDLQLLPISDEQKHWLIRHCGPISHNYIAASTLSPKSRASFLLGALNEGKQSSHHSISSSRKRKN